MITKTDKMGDIQYVMCFPESFDENKKYPFLIYLNGAGSRGDTIDAITVDNLFYDKLKEMEEIPYIVLIPLCSKDTWIDLWYDLRTLFTTIASEKYIDKNRIYGMGVSMGGYGIWQLAMALPEYFAAIIPICGAGMYFNAIKLKDIPVWAFHGALDTVVYPCESEFMVNAVNACGGNAKLTIYPERDHDAWTDTFNNPEVLKWLLSQSKK